MYNWLKCSQLLTTYALSYINTWLPRGQGPLLVVFHVGTGVDHVAIRFQFLRKHGAAPWIETVETFHHLSRFQCRPALSFVNFTSDSDSHFRPCFLLFGVWSFFVFFFISLFRCLFAHVSRWVTCACQPIRLNLTSEQTWTSWRYLKFKFVGHHSHVVNISTLSTKRLDRLCAARKMSLGHSRGAASAWLRRTRWRYQVAWTTRDTEVGVKWRNDGSTWSTRTWRSMPKKWAWGEQRHNLAHQNPTNLFLFYKVHSLWYS